MKHSSRDQNQTLFERLVAAQLLKMLGSRSAIQKGERSMFAVIARLFTEDAEDGEEMEVQAECIRYCETEKEAEDCDLGGDFIGAEREIFDLNDSGEREEFFSSITPMADYVATLIPENDGDEEE